VADRICVAQIGGPHGIRGEVKLKSFTADPLAVKDYGPLTSEDGSAQFELETVRPAKSHLVARFRGVGDRNAAERLTNLKLFVPRDRLPPPAAAEVGTVVAIHDFGAGDILELRPPAGGASLLLPFTDTFVPSVDIAGGRIVVVPMEATAATRDAATDSSG
jgi:16S rRNA processing protein RimM